MLVGIPIETEHPVCSSRACINRLVDPILLADSPLQSSTINRLILTFEADITSDGILSARTCKSQFDTTNLVFFTLGVAPLIPLVACLNRDANLKCVDFVLGEVRN